MSTTEYDREVCRMQDAETVLNVIRERGERELPLEKHLSAAVQPEPYLRAYTVASTQTRELRLRELPQRPWTVCHWRKSTASSTSFVTSGFRWTPVRRVNIPKPNGTTRARLQGLEPAAVILEATGGLELTLVAALAAASPPSA